MELIRLRRGLIEETRAAGLMAFRRSEAPRIAAGTVGEIGPLRGAAKIAFDTVLTPEWIGTRF